MSIWKSIHDMWDAVCYEVGGIGYKSKRKQRVQYRDTPRGSSSIDSFQSDYNRHRHQR